MLYDYACSMHLTQIDPYIIRIRSAYCLPFGRMAVRLATGREHRESAVKNGNLFSNSQSRQFIIQIGDEMVQSPRNILHSGIHFWVQQFLNLKKNEKNFSFQNVPIALIPSTSWNVL